MPHVQRKQKENIFCINKETQNLKHNLCSFPVLSSRDCCSSDLTYLFSFKCMHHYSYIISAFYLWHGFHFHYWVHFLFFLQSFSARAFAIILESGRKDCGKVNYIWQAIQLTAQHHRLPHSNVCSSFQVTSHRHGLNLCYDCPLDFWMISWKLIYYSVWDTGRCRMKTDGDFERRGRGVK